MKYDYDMVVIGGGAAGLTAAGMAASFGARTALVEAARLGGDCTWHGCIPSKTLLKSAALYHSMNTAGKYGFRDVAPYFDIRDVLKHVRQTQQGVYEEADRPEIYEKMGVHVLKAKAQFLDRHTVELFKSGVEPEKVTSQYFVIATGSTPLVPQIPGLSEVGFYTNETIFGIDFLPQKLAVIGAGPIGIELAQGFKRLGSDVVVIDSGERILKNDDAELAGLLKTELQNEGIEFLLKAEISMAGDFGKRKRVFLKTAENPAPKIIECDALLIATGRKPSVDTLNLTAAGVHYTEKGIQINESCRTNVSNIYACGDVAGGLQFTHIAEHHAKIAVSRALLKLPLKINTTVPWVTYTAPELAHVGMTEDVLKASGIKYQVYRFPFSKIDRAVTDGKTAGMIKVFAKSGSGTIYGASILGEHAGEMIAEYGLAIKNGISLKQVADTIHAYPTYALGNRRAADQWYIQKQSPALVKVLKKLFGYRGQVPQKPGKDTII